VNEFSERVRRRSSRIQLVSEGSGLRTLVIEIVPERDTLQASVRIVEIDGTERARNLKAKDCNEAIDGLALIATVSLDPEAILSPPPEPPPEPKQPLKPPPAPPRPPEKKPEKPPIPGAKATAAEKSWRFGGGAQGTLLAEVAPRHLYGPSVLAWVEYRTNHWLSPLARLSASTLLSRPELERTLGTARFAVPILGTFDACVVRLGTESLGLHGCASLLIGSLSAEGDDTDDPQSHTRPFAALGGSLVGVLDLVGSFQIFADVRAGYAPIRHRFQFAPTDEFFTMPYVPVSAGAGVGVGFQ